MELTDYDAGTIGQGYYFNQEKQEYACLACGKAFSAGEIFQFEDRFFEAHKAVQLHMVQEHADWLKQLLHTESRYVSFTDTQKELLELIYEGLSDREIAEKTGISQSTVRHQRFTFREKAKQAKMYLAIYELVDKAKREQSVDVIVPVHGGAKMVDERYILTEEEEKTILKNVFESLSPLKLKVFSAKEKKKVVILRKIAEQFEQSKVYTEKEINEILKSIYEDYVTLRRYLVEYGFMTRTRDCREYRRVMPYEKL